MKGIYQKINEIKRKTRDREIRVKLELFLLALKLGDVSEACARRGLGRTFYYKWWKRFKRSGYELSSLYEVSRKPRISPCKISTDLELKIKKLRRRGYGCIMLEGMLKRDGTWISHSTINHVLNDRKRIKFKRRKKIKAHGRRYELPIPGQRMQMDVKYVPYLVDGRRLYNYSIVDECSRWKLSRAYPELNPHYTVEFLNELEKKSPFPINCIQTDNGFEFTFSLSSTATRKQKHPMDIWCEQKGIRHRLIPPGEKELNGKIERSHRIDEQYFFWRASRKSLTSFNLSQNKWLYTYNYQRPHGGLKFKTPIEKLKICLTDLSLCRFENTAIDAIRQNFLKHSPKNFDIMSINICKLYNQLEQLTARDYYN